MGRALLVVLALACACNRVPRPGEAVEYRPADGSFSARVPSDWKADESPGETRKAAFFGPAQGAKPFSELMGVYFHPASDPAAAARDYLASEPPADFPAQVRDVLVGGARGMEVSFARAEPDPHHGAQRVSVRMVAMPVAGGFFLLQHSWPAGAAPGPAFDELLRTFRPASPRG